MFSERKVESGLMGEGGGEGRWVGAGGFGYGEICSGDCWDSDWGC